MGVWRPIASSGKRETAAFTYFAVCRQFCGLQLSIKSLSIIPRAAPPVILDSSKVLLRQGRYSSRGEIPSKTRYHMKAINIRLVDSSRAFDVSELFFSTTDRKGIITGCNDVFVRVSGYKAEDLLGEPHNIVRHPHMPQCVFKLLWDYLLAGKAIGAYVKNLASTGEYYWVFALATPTKDGFLSIRLKPTTEILSVIETLYGSLLQRERFYAPDWKKGMQEAGVLLNEELRRLGFSSYDHFMNHALREEMIGRQTQLQVATREPSQPQGRSNIGNSLVSPADKLASLSSVVSLGELLAQQGELLSEVVVNLHRLALNSSIRAAHIGDLGRALGIVGEEVARVSGQIDDEVSTITREREAVSTALGRTSFDISLAALQSEMANCFVSDAGSMSLSEQEQVARFGRPLKELGEVLLACAEDAVSRSRETTIGLGVKLNEFEYVLESLAKVLVTIQFAYVTGKSEAARVPGGEAFSVLLDDLVSLSKSAKSGLESLAQAVTAARATVTRWNRLEPLTKPVGYQSGPAVSLETAGPR